MFTARFCYLVTRQTLAEVTEAKYVEGFFLKKVFLVFCVKGQIYKYLPLDNTYWTFSLSFWSQQTLIIIKYGFLRN